MQSLQCKPLRACSVPPILVSVERDRDIIALPITLFTLSKARHEWGIFFLFQVPVTTVCPLPKGDRSKKIKQSIIIAVCFDKSGSCPAVHHSRMLKLIVIRTGTPASVRRDSNASHAKGCNWFWLTMKHLCGYADRKNEHHVAKYLCDSVPSVLWRIILL